MKETMAIRINFPLLLLLSLLVLLIGCNGNPFIGNIFDGIDEYKLDVDLETASTNDLLEEFSNGGDDFLDAIDTEEEYDAVTATLNTAINDPGTSPSKIQDAAVLLADVYLHYSGIDEVLDETSSHLDDLADKNYSAPADLADLVFGEDATAEEIAAGLVSLLGTADALEAYGNTLDLIDPPPAADGALLGVQALSAGVFSLMIDDMVASGYTEENAIIDLAAYLYDSSLPDPSGSDLSFLELTGDMTDAEVEAQLETGLGNGLTNVVIEGGIADLLQTD